MTIQNKHPNVRGFTLVELAIVITIIGILIGGVLKGQQLIEQARLAATINQINNYRSALSIFKTTYNELPGDMIDPDARIVGCTGCKATINTQGDGFIGNGNFYMSQLNNNSEATRFWLHLMKANMISGVSDAALNTSTPVIGETHPAAKISGALYAETGQGRLGSDYGYSDMWGDNNQRQINGLSVGIRGNLTSSYTDQRIYDVLSPQAAAQIDRKLDDGKPLSGEVRGLARDRFQGCAINGNNYAEAETSNKICTIAAVIGE